MITPCYGCQKRKAGCAIGCEAWMTHVEQRDKLREARHKDQEARSYHDEKSAERFDHAVKLNALRRAGHKF